MTGWTFHGGKLDAARQIFGDGQAPWMDLSTGINPDSWPVEKAPVFDWRALPGEENLLGPLREVCHSRDRRRPAFDDRLQPAQQQKVRDMMQRRRGWMASHG